MGLLGAPQDKSKRHLFFFAAASSSSRGQILYVGISKTTSSTKSKWINRHFVWSDFNHTDFKVNSKTIYCNGFLDHFSASFLINLSLPLEIVQEGGSTQLVVPWLQVAGPQKTPLSTAQLLWRNAAMNHGGGPSSNGGDLVNLAAWWSASLSPWFLSEISHLHRNVLCMSKTFNLVVLANTDMKNPMRVPWGFRNRLRQTFPEGVLWIWINYLASDKWAKIDLEKTPSWQSEAAFWMDKLSQPAIGEPSLGRCHTEDFSAGQEMAVFITGQFRFNATFFLNHQKKPPNL